MLMLATALGASCNKGLKLTGDAATVAPEAGGLMETQVGLESGACGDRTLAGYWVPASACLAQTLPKLPDHQSREGFVCSLDLYLSEAAPTGAVPQACAGQPVTSQCFLEEIGYLESVSSGIVGFPHVSMLGTMRTENVCTLRADCTSKAASCSDCQPQAVFVPCVVSSAN